MEAEAAGVVAFSRRRIIHGNWDVRFSSIVLRRPVNALRLGMFSESDEGNNNNT